mmetsp:Transcript_25433/g.52664  ORF Transcript_25433/g.52664 Transcript_25433/m.52664 type:complete len:196 (-) Transcript_25433:465-1052(-)
MRLSRPCPHQSNNEIIPNAYIIQPGQTHKSNHSLAASVLLHSHKSGAPVTPQQHATRHMDIKNFYLNTPLDIFEYLRMPISHILSLNTNSIGRPDKVHPRNSRYFLYNSRAVDPTMMAALSSIASALSKGTVKTCQAVEKFLDYCHTHPNACITYKMSRMHLAVDSDASYLSEPAARSLAAAHFYLTTASQPLNN